MSRATDTMLDKLAHAIAEANAGYSTAVLQFSDGRYMGVTAYSVKTKRAALRFAVKGDGVLEALAEKHGCKVVPYRKRKEG